MGSRAIIIVCRGEQTARQRFGILEAEAGICYTRTGRRFFENLSSSESYWCPFGAPSIEADSGSVSTRIGCASIAS